MDSKKERKGHPWLLQLRGLLKNTKTLTHVKFEVFGLVDPDGSNNGRRRKGIGVLLKDKEKKIFRSNLRKLVKKMKKSKQSITHVKLAYDNTFINLSEKERKTLFSAIGTLKNLQCLEIYEPDTREYSELVFYPSHKIPIAISLLSKVGQCTTLSAKECILEGNDNDFDYFLQQCCVSKLQVTELTLENLSCRSARQSAIFLNALLQVKSLEKLVINNFLSHDNEDDLITPLGTRRRSDTLNGYFGALGNNIRVNASKLKETKIHDDIIRDDGIEVIIKRILPQVKFLETLELKCRFFGSKSHIALSRLLEESGTKIRALSIHGSNVENSDDGIATALKQNSTLEKLDLRHFNFGGNFCTQFENSLRFNNTLKDVRITDLGRYITSRGWKAIAQVIQHNTTLENLSIDWSRLDDNICFLLADALKSNRKLRKLKFDLDEKITDTGLEAFKNCLQNNNFSLCSLFDYHYGPSLWKIQYRHQKFKDEIDFYLTLNEKYQRLKLLGGDENDFDRDDYINNMIFCHEEYHSNNKATRISAEYVLYYWIRSKPWLFCYG